MKKIFLIISITLSCVFGTVVSAQTVQSGTVSEYKEALKKRPLGGVELLISNAPTTVSDKGGKFSLQFQTLKPGQKVNIRRIEKSGYEIFNKDALDQWNINPDEPFVILMVRSDRFKEIKDNYNRVSSKSYEEQYLKEKERLQKEHEDGKLTIDQLRSEIVNLQEEYDRQLLNLDNYIDRFARIDLSALSKNELEIIELVQNGEIDKAIQKYDELNLINDYAQTIDDLSELQSANKAIQNQIAKTIRAKEALSAQLLNNISLLQLKGGRESFAKIGQMYKELIAIDPTDIMILNQYVSHCVDQNFMEEAIATLDTILSFELTLSQRIKSLIALSGVYITTLDYDSAQSTLSQAMDNLTLLENQPTADSYEIDQYRSQIYDNLGISYQKQREYRKAEEQMVKAHDIRSSLYAKDKTNYTMEHLAKSKHNLANIYLDIKQFDKAVVFYNEAISLFVVLTDVDKKYGGKVADTMCDLATCYQTCLDYNNAESHYLNAITILQSLISSNPNQYNGSLCMAYTNLATLYIGTHDYDKATQYFKLAEDIYDMSEEFMTRTMMFNRAMMHNNWGNALLLNNDMDSAKLLYMNSIEALAFLGHYQYELSTIYSNLATIEMYSGNFQDAVSYYENCLNYLKLLYQDNPDAYCFDLGRVQLNLCTLYSQYLNDQDKARNYCDMAIASFEHAVRLNEAYKSFLSLAFTSKAYSYAYSEDYVQAIMIFDECIARWPDDANIYDSKGEVFLMLEQYEQAKQMWDKVMELDPDFLKTHQSTLYTKLKEMGMIS